MMELLHVLEMEDAVQEVCNATGCSDIDLVSQVLEVEDYNVESAIFAILQMNELKRISKYTEFCSGRLLVRAALWEGNGTGSRIFGNQSLHQGEIENKGKRRSYKENQASRNPKASKKQKKEQQRLEKKKRQEERHRQKVLGSKSNCPLSDMRDVDSTNHVTLVKAIGALNI
uniref:Uncharacterized protein n=1 Tax=Amazona collaria TaxID=241587 RepID=A0A8B9FY71_9PSIT